MKQTLYLVSFVLMGTIASSCKTEKDACQQCAQLPPSEQISLKVGGITTETKFWNEPSRPGYTFGYSEIKSPRDFNKIVASLEVPLLRNIDIAGLVVYTAQDPSSGNNVLSGKDLLGYSYYYRKNNKLRHAFYLRESNGSFRVVSSLNGETRNLSSNNILGIARLYFLDDHEKVTAIAFRNDQVYLVSNVSKSNTVGYSIEYLLRQKYPNTSGKPYSECAAPCSGAQDECENTTHGWSCDHSTDEENDASQAAMASSLGIFSQEEIDAAYNLPLHYQFRDQFLWDRERLGHKYIDYYYNMTVTAYLTDSIIRYTVPFLQELNTKLPLLINHSQHTNEVLIDANLAQKASFLLQLYKRKAPNSIESQWFSDIENDLQYYTGKTIGEIVADM